MKTYIKPELKYLSMVQESLMAGSEKVLPPEEELEEGANKYGMSIDEEAESAPKSVWE